MTDAIGRINLTSHKSGATLPKVGLMHAPLATPESMDLGNEYAQVKVKWKIINCADWVLPFLEPNSIISLNI